MNKDYFLKKKETAVSSYAYGPDMFYADKHEQLPSPAQYTNFKETYRNSYGKTGVISMGLFSQITAFYEGQRTSYISKGALVEEFCFGQDFLITRFCGVPKGQLLNEQVNIGDAVICLPGGGYNIHHFILEILPSLILMKKEILEFDVLVLGGFDSSTFIHELLAIFLPEIKIKLIKPNTVINATDSAVLGSFPYKIYPTEIVSEIRKTVKDLSNAIVTKCENSEGTLYFSRGDNERNRRFLVNQDLFLERCQSAMRRLHVTTPALQTIFETTSLAVKFGSFLGQSGGGLIHVIWGETGSKVIEIKPDGFIGNSEIFDLCRLFDFNYFEAISISESTDWRNSSQSLDERQIQEIISIID